MSEVRLKSLTSPGAASRRPRGLADLKLEASNLAQEVEGRPHLVPSAASAAAAASIAILLCNLTVYVGQFVI